jgi:hypothetical protein
MEGALRERLATVELRHYRGRDPLGNKPRELNWGSTLRRTYWRTQVFSDYFIPDESRTGLN